MARILAERRAWGPIDRELVKSGPGGLRRDERKPRTVWAPLWGKSGRESRWPRA